jgi:hypothetical protein
MSTEFEITLSYERTMTFKVKADSAYEAYRDAAEGFEYGDLRPDDEGVSELQLEAVQVGEREIRVMRHLDYNAPKDARGLTPWTFVAHGDSGRLGENPDLEQLLATHAAVEVVRPE